MLARSHVTRPKPPLAGLPESQLSTLPPLDPVQAASQTRTAETYNPAVCIIQGNHLTSAKHCNVACLGQTGSRLTACRHSQQNEHATQESFLHGFYNITLGYLFPASEGYMIVTHALEHRLSLVIPLS